MMDAEGLPRQVVVVWQVSSLRVTSPGTGLWYVPVRGMCWSRISLMRALIRSSSACGSSMGTSLEEKGCNDF